MRVITLLLILFFIKFCYSQNDNSTSFNVKKIKNSITVFPNDNLLEKGSLKQVEFNITGDYVITKVEMSGGEVIKKGDKYFLKATSLKEAVLVVYGNSKDYKNIILLSKKYKIFKYPDPTVTVCGVAADSFITRDKLVATGEVWVKSNIKKNEFLPVISFNLIVNTNKLDTLRAKSSKFTPKMRDYVYTLDDGDVVSVDSVLYRSKYGEIKLLKGINIYISNLKYYKHEY